MLGLRWFLSGIMLLIILFFLYRKDAFKGITLKNILNSLLIGFFIMILNNGLFSESMKTLDSYLAATISATMPIFMVIFDYLLNKKKTGKSALFAIILGFFGIAILLYNGKIKVRI